jgi:hypothetical protein
LKTRNGNIKSTGKQSTPKAEEGYCNEATQSGPLTHSQSHQAQHTAEHEEVKHRQAWKKEEIGEVIWCYMYCRQHFTGNYVSTIPGNHEVKELQKTAILGTAHILRKVLM